MLSNEIRQLFLRFFEENDHRIIPSSSLIPHGDPTLLLTAAGMVQLKPYFTGEAIPPYPRLTSCQKCFRTTDIEAVGDLRHLTFFEMLGNFSVGNYFKKEAISYGWEFVTEKLKLPPKKLWVTIYKNDDEAFEYWRALHIPAEKIIRHGEKDNFWGPAGNSGPCGPCSEIYYDFGEEVGCCKPDCLPGCDCDRFLEIWNLVFMQYNQDINGNRSPLPKTNIDTGMGLERIAAVMQGKRTFYDTDVFKILIKTVSDLSGHKYGHNERTDRAIRIVAEHCRSVAFLIGDGVLPSNEGRGYVLRRVLRRAALFGKTLDMESPFIAKIADVAINGMSAFYADLNEHKQVILNVINTEEEKFSQTLNTGLSIIENIMEELKKKGEKIIPGKEVFRLYDTYGFPRELTAEVAAENGLITDSKGFDDEMERQRQRARASQKTISKEKAAVSYTLLPPTDFVGYRQLKVDARIMSLAVDGHIEERMSRGQQVEVILDKTPFYAEMGGQVTDTGTITGRTGSILITFVKRDKADHFIHYGEVTNGEVTNGDPVVAEVDVERRLDIARNHTATHLLQAALRKILGMHVQQMGSLVDPDRLRFDFSHNSAISRENLLKVQELVNRLTRSNLQVIAKENISIDRAKAEGATALFGEKYGDIVRVIEIRKPADPVVSMELCGGTHLEATGQIGFFYILSESGIGSGIRRIEAVTGRVAEKIFEERVQSLESAAKLFGTSVNEVDSKLKSVIEEINSQKKLIAELKHAKMLESVSKEVSDLVKTKIMLNGVAIITGHVSASNIEVLRQVGDLVKQQMDSGVIVLGAIWDDKPNFLAMVSADLTKKGLHAGQIVKQVAQVTGGSGGGRPELGQAGGKDKSKMEEALKMVETLVNKS